MPRPIRLVLRTLGRQARSPVNRILLAMVLALILLVLGAGVAAPTSDGATPRQTAGAGR